MKHATRTRPTCAAAETPAATLYRGRAGDRGAAAGARPLSGRDADRQSAATSRLRALEILAAADLIACEDTRVTRKLFDHYGIATPLTPYHDHNAEAARPKILARLAAGRSGRAGLRCRHAADLRSRLPAGARRGARPAIAVTALPGASAVLAALTVAGPADRPFLLRRIPAAEGRPRGSARIAELAAHPGDAGAVRERAAHRRLARRSRGGLGARDAAICRELTKLHEEVRRGTLATLARDYADGAETRGEIVIVIAPPAARGAARRGRDRRAVARSASARLGEGCGGRGRGRDRRCRAATVYQRALALAKEDAMPRG